MVTGPGSPRLRILVAVEHTDAARQAELAAHRLFGADAEYLFINVGDPDAHAELERDRMAPFLHAVGDIATAIVDAAHEHAVDVIVVGSHDRSWFSRLFDPSTSRHIVGASDLPVLVVKPTVSEPSRLVLVATDGTLASFRAARTAARLFGSAARYQVVHVAPDRPDPNADATGFAGPLIDDEEADEIFRETVVDSDAVLAATASEVGPIAVEQTALFGDPVFLLCQWAKDSGAGVLVVGTTGASGLMHVLLGSVSKGVIAHCECPVLVVPN